MIINFTCPKAVNMKQVMNQSAWVLRNTAKKIFQAFILILFFGSIFILLGKQLYKGVLTQKCVFLPPDNTSNVEYSEYVSNSSHWLEEKDGYFLCGNGTGSRPCPENYTCLKGANANSYVSHFNFYGSSVVTISQLMTLHFWQELYQRMLLTAGTLHVTYFVFAFYSFLYSSGLILALITRAYRIQLKELETSEKDSDLALKINSRCDVSKGIAKSPSCKSYELFSSQVLSVDKIGRQVSESFECADTILKPESIRSREHMKKNRSESSKCHVSSDRSNDSSTNCSRILKHFSLIRKWMRSHLFEFCTEIFFAAAIIVFLVTSVLRFSHRLDPDTFVIFYKVFGAISAWEMLIKLIAYGPRLYFQNNWNRLDATVLIISGAEVVLFQFKNSMMLVLRAFKLVRLMVCCSTCNYLIYIMDASLCMFQSPISVLLVFMCICVVSGMQLYGIEYFHSTDRFPNQEPPRWYFKDCYSSFLLVFCMLCGDWKQPMVNTVLFTSCASDLFMLIFVLFGNLVVMNLFLGVVFYTFFYKTYSKNSCNTGRKIQNAFQIILHGQNHVHCPKINSRERKGHNQATIHASSSDMISDTHDYSNHPFEEGSILDNHPGQIDESSSEYMADCCPALCYFCCSFCKADENPVLWQNWADVRCKLYYFVEQKVFRIVVFIVILISIALLIMSHSPGPAIPEIIQAIQILNPCIFLLFAVEMFLKWMAYGLQKYFKSHLGRLEFFIILVYLLDLLPITFFEGQKNIFKALKSFRLLSVIPLLKSYQESVPLPSKQNESTNGSTNASKESLLHLRTMECNHFLGRNCGYRPSGSGEILQMDWNIIEVSHEDTCMSKMKRVELNNVTEFRNRSSPIAASHCLPDMFYNWSWCREDHFFWTAWKSARTKVLLLVSSKYFSACHGFAIIISCSMLAVEASFALEKPAIVILASYYIDRIWTLFLFLEILLKWFGLGFREYFSSLFCILEFIVSLASISYIILDQLEVSHLEILKIVRVCLLLYLCKMLGFNKQAQHVVASLGHGFPTYFVAFFFITFLWLIFAILSVAMFEKKLSKCVDGNGDILRMQKGQSFHFNETDCVMQNGTLKNSVVNFDSIENALIALLQVATLQDWMDFVTDIMDNVNDYNRMRNEIYTALFFPIFIMFSTFLTVNFFAGITCWIFNDLKRDERGAESHTEALYKSAVTKMESTKLKKRVPEPKLQFQAFLYRMVTSDNFEIAGFVLIGLHMLLIALDMYDPHPSEMFILAMTELNVFFIVIFTVECIMKMLALRHYYFLCLWNHFDVFVLILCVCGALFQDLFSSPMLPAMLRLVRFLRCTRYLRRYARGMLPLLHALHRSLPACLALLAVQFAAMFAYAVLGVHLFRREPGFETFARAMLLLFQLSTLAGYADVLGALAAGPLGTLYVVSYVVVVYYVVIKTHLIVVLDSLEDALHESENVPLAEDYEMFVEVWQRFDHRARGVLPFARLADLLDAMEEPFRFCRPNRLLIASLNLPIYEGELVFYADLMDALARDYMGQRAHLPPPPDGLPALLDDEGRTRRKVGSSLWRQRQHHCARLIQGAWRKYAGRDPPPPSPVFYSEVRLASADRVDTCLAGEPGRAASHASV